jgi:hypothetical protein
VHYIAKCRWRFFLCTNKTIYRFTNISGDYETCRGKEEAMPHSENLLSQKEVAKRWGCDTSTIARREKDGLIKRALAIPGVWYTRASVERAEGLEGDESPMSPFERRRLEKRIRELEKKVSGYEDQFYFLSDAMERAKKMMN